MGVLLTALALMAAPSLDARPAGDESEVYFDAATAPVDLTIVIAPEDVEKLKADARAYVPFVLMENGKEVARGGGVKLKGAAGSFREFDDRPALTLKLDKFGGTSRFHGLEKFHLNNSVQDESLLNEWVCSEVFRSAGYPAPRVSHARVRINDRDLGFYVLKEGFDRRFLSRNFRRSNGNLYDGGFCQDLDAELELDLSGGEKERADLKRLVAACGEQDPAKARKALEEQVDVAAFLKFMALELMLGHWDGYCQNVNNYRVYFEPGSTGRAHFLPHGMDQVLGDPGASVLDGPRGMLAAAIMRDPAWRAAYREQVKALLPFFDAKKLEAKVEALERRLQPALKAASPELAENQANQAKELVDRLKAREANLREQAEREEPKPLEFPAGQAVAIEQWTQTGDSEGALFEDTQLDGEDWRRLVCGTGEQSVISWRSPLTLPAGRYRLDAEGRAEDVEPLEEEGARGRGAGVRISGGTRTQGLVGTQRRPLRYEFTVEEPHEVLLVLELRASKGWAAFRQVTLTRLEEKATE